METNNPNEFQEVDNIGKVQPRPIVSEMEESYLSYAMSVIVTRALPDVRDGLKPVQRRILYSMWKLGLRSGAKFRKSATVVGEVLGKYHPHGDASVYIAMVRMAQEFSLRYPLVEGQGNFGSMDGDNPAAMRYTEAKLQSISDEMLFDIEKETVDWNDNYDGTRKEPATLPAKLPQLLLNGALGIAVGMATNIPPHNLSELVDGIVAYIKNPGITVEGLVKHIQGPDFPTSGLLYNRQDILEAYSTGRGGMVTRAQADIVEVKNGQFQIVVSEITYQTNKATLIQKIAHLVKTGKIEGIRDIRDETDKEGVRIVVELKKDAYPKKVLNQLYSMTELQKTFHLNMLALVDGIEPRVLNLKSVIEYYVAHRQTVVTRRTEFELRKAQERAHILEGLKKALDHINEVIETIRGSATKEKAHENLVAKFKFTDRQTEAILEMRLQTLAGLERKKIEDELAEKLKLIAELEAILADPQKILDIIKDELLEIKKKYGDERRTKIVDSKAGEFSQEDLVANEETIISFTEDGYIKRIAPTILRSQKRGGQGVAGGNIKEGDAVDKVLTTMTHDDLFFFTTSGRVFKLKTYEIPQSSRTAKGQAIVNFIQIAPEEKITSILAVSKDTQCKYMVMQTRGGKIKKTALKDFENVRRSGMLAIRLDEDDTLGWVGLTDGTDDLILTTKKGQSIRFQESQARPMGRIAGGVKAMRLKKGDEIVSMSVIRKSAIGGDEKNLQGESKNGTQLLVLMENGYGKRTPLERYKAQSRAGSGIKTAFVTEKTGQLVAAHVITKEDQEEKADLIVSSNRGQIIRTPIDKISVLNRATQGVRIMKLKKGEKIAASAVL
jgi:DNA gyrase subunit A